MKSDLLEQARKHLNDYGAGNGHETWRLFRLLIARVEEMETRYQNADKLLEEVLDKWGERDAALREIGSIVARNAVSATAPAPEDSVQSALAET